MSILGLFALALAASCLVGCPSASNEPPPPPSKPEIPTAPPHALGALAAGTDAAPRPDVTLPGNEGEPAAPTPPLEPPSEGPPPEGSAPEGAAPEGPPPTEHPDAGMAL